MQIKNAIIHRTTNINLNIHVCIHVGLQLFVSFIFHLRSEDMDVPAVWLLPQIHLHGTNNESWLVLLFPTKPW